MKRTLIATALLFAMAATSILAQGADPLPSWNDGKSKQSIVWKVIFPFERK